MGNTPTDGVGDAELTPDRVAPIVVGAHLRAEIEDRASAGRLRDLLAGCLRTLTPVVVTDLWYLNADELRAQPTISVGGPERNALTAQLGDRVPSAYVADDVLMVQLDVELADLTACCWGVDGRATAAAVGVFVDRYLERWASAADQVTPRV